MLSENCATFVNYIQPVVYNWFLQALRLFLAGAQKSHENYRCVLISTSYMYREECKKARLRKRNSGSEN